MLAVFTSSHGEAWLSAWLTPREVGLLGRRSVSFVSCLSRIDLSKDEKRDYWVKIITAVFQKHLPHLAKTWVRMAGPLGSQELPDRSSRTKRR
eukprot:2378664-Pleurochrysis_carterae.AAC.1